MIVKRIILDKKGILDQKLIIMILVILVVVVTIVFLFKSNAFAFLENFLPDLSVGENNRIIEEGDNEVIVEGEVSEIQLAELMKNEAKCSCGDDCENHAKLISKYSGENSVNSVLVLALIIQESGCKKDAGSGSSYGLMQINAGVWCGSYGLPEKTDKDKCIKELYILEKNIEVGIKILKEGYTTEVKVYSCESFVSRDNDGKIIQNEKAINEIYSGWGRALRSYNGWGCAGYRNDGSEIFADQDYVENVNALYTKLKQNIK